MTSLDLMPENVPETWEECFEDCREDLKDIAAVLTRKKMTDFYPLKTNLYRPFECKLTDVKVVILGETPYDVLCSCGEHPRADGLAFSVSECDEPPNQLKNIMTESGTEKGSIDHWVKNGVLLLNICLTTSPGRPKSHGAIWYGFIQKVFKAIDKVNPKCIYLLWGREVKELLPWMTDSCLKLESWSPNSWKGNGFLGNGHFKKVNEILIERGDQKIDW